MNLRKITTRVAATFTAAVMVITNMPMGTVFAAEGSWTDNGDDTYSYTQGADATAAIPEFALELPSGKNWADVTYISVKVVADHTIQPVIVGNLDSVWTEGSAVWMQDGGESTVYYETNGKTGDDLKIQFWNDPIATGKSVTLSEITFSSGPMPDPVGVWFEKDGAQCYQNGSNASGWVGIDLRQYVADNSLNWATTKYVSATVEGTDGASMGISMNFTGSDTDWESSGDKALSSTPVKICFATNGKTPVDASVNTQSLPANASVKITDITFHDTFDGFEGPIGSWYQLEDYWYYQNGNSGVGWIPELVVDTTSVTDWTKIKYISADVTTTEKANIGFGDEEHQLADGNTVTLYLDNNGTEPTNPRLTVWWYDNENEVAVEANNLIKVKFNFSTQARPVYDKWYEVENDVWKYVDSADGIAGNGNTSFCLNDYTDVDLTGVKYVSATIIVENGSATTCFSANNADYSVCKDGSSVSTNNGTNTSYMFCYEGDYTKLMYGIWEISDGATVTLKDLSFSKTDLTNYENIVGQIVQTSENSYYYNGGDADSTDVVFPLVYDGNMADVQTITMTTRISGTGSIDLGISGSDENDGWVEGYNFPASTTEMTVTRKYRGCIYKNPLLHIKTFGPGYKVYVSDIIFDTNPVEVTYTNPNDILIDDNTSIVNDWNSQHEIGWTHLSRIEVPGTLKINVEFVDNQTYPDLHMVVPVLNEWSDTCNIVEGGWMQITDEAIFMQEEGYCEVPITAEYVDIIQDSAKNECEFAVTGLGIIVTEVIFTPDPTVEKPKQEEVTADKVTQEEKQKLESSKNNTHDEKNAKDKATDGKIQGHKYHKKDKNGRDIYSLRIVKMVDKKLLQHAESVTITVYSRKADKYVTFTADCCFSYLNIYGEKVKANDKNAFLTVIIDNVQADDEITFTDFTINYKK